MAKKKVALDLRRLGRHGWLTPRTAGRVALRGNLDFRRKTAEVLVAATDSCIEVVGEQQLLTTIPVFSACWGRGAAAVGSTMGLLGLEVSAWAYLVATMCTVTAVGVSSGVLSLGIILTDRLVSATDHRHDAHHHAAPATNTAAAASKLYNTRVTDGRLKGPTPASPVALRVRAHNRSQFMRPRRYSDWSCVTFRKLSKVHFPIADLCDLSEFTLYILPIQFSGNATRHSRFCPSCNSCLRTCLWSLRDPAAT